MIKKIGFLLGSGISIPACYPSTNDITSRILNGDRVTRHTDSTYYLSESENNHIYIGREFVQPVVILLNSLYREIRQLTIDKRDTNYEDLYYIVKQILDNEYGEYENPVIGAFIEKITADLEGIKTHYPVEIFGPWDFYRLLQEAENYIRDVAWRMLQINLEPDKLKHLNSICNACSDNDFENIDIFTLNHDTLLETALDYSHIPYNLGFGESINNVSYWNLNVSENNGIKVRLFKLHGSIDWFLFSPNKNYFGNIVGRVPIGEDIWYTINPSGGRQTPFGGRPEFLVGTFNKMLQYTSDIYADLFCIFRRLLRTTDYLIICGYGFRDKGINSQIVEWMFQPNRYLIIIHQDPMTLKNSARNAIIKFWDSWLEQGRLTIIEKFIQNTSWLEIKGCLTRND